MDEIYEFSAAEGTSEPVTFAGVAGPSQAEGQPMRASGLGVVYGQLSEPRKLPDGKIVQWRFAANSAKPVEDVRVLYMHQPGAILGRTSNGTAQFNHVDGGVEFSVDLPDTQLGRDVAYLLKRGDLKASSVGVTGARGRVSKSDNGGLVFDVAEFSYREVSIVDAPGFSAATAGLAPEPVIVDTTHSGEPAPETTEEKSVDAKEERARVTTKLKLAELQRQSIARAFSSNKP